MNFSDVYCPNPEFSYRYISPEQLENFLHHHFSNSIEVIGTSTLGKSIYKLSLGTGEKKVLAWSQMHGNESNGTHAMLDMWHTLLSAEHLAEDLFGQLSLDFVFQLNPDGSELWTRRNAYDIDLNRDFLKMSSKELPFLKALVERQNYDFAFNLHEQRTIFSTDGIHPATLSFLSPSEDVERTVTKNRKKVMAVAARIYEQLKSLLPYGMGRYTDEFYPASVGDNFMKMGIPTLLFEGGHFQGDYYRKHTRKFYTIAFYEGLKAVIDLNGKIMSWEKYLEIPENKESHFDVVYRNVSLNTDFPCVLDIAVQYKEVLNEGASEIDFIPIVVEVGDCSRKKGWKEEDCTGKLFKSRRVFPKLNAPQDFEIIG